MGNSLKTEPVTEQFSQEDVLRKEEYHLSGGDIGEKDLMDQTGFIKRRLSKDHQRSALCLSGGGIRSATFSLGVIQGLAKAGLLRQFDYLSTVSGGGFIGSWLSRWINEQKDQQYEETSGQGEVCSALKEVERRLVEDKPEPEPVRNLRAHSSYLSPKRGFSRDMATLAAIVLRNMSLTWLIILPAIAGFLLLPSLFSALLIDYGNSIPFGYGGLIFLLFLGVWFGVFHFLWGSDQSTRKSVLLGIFPLLVAAILCVGWQSIWEIYFDWEVHKEAIGRNISYPALATISVLAIPFFLGGVFILNGVFQGLFSRWLPEKVRERSSRNGAILIRVAVFWLLLASIVFLLPPLLFDAFGLAPVMVSGVGGVSAVLAILAGFFGRSGDTQPSTVMGSWNRWINRNIVPIICFGFLIFIAGLLSIAISKSFQTWIHENDREIENVVFIQPISNIKQGESEEQKQKEESQVSPATTFWPTLMFQMDKDYRTSMINRSWHTILAAVLICFGFAITMSWFFGVNRFSLHAMYGNRLVRAYLAAARGARNPDLETGFDEKDNIAFSELSSNRPFHIVNAAMNLGATDKAEWAQRKSASFTFSALHSGSHAVGFVPSEKYSDDKKGISLGKAMTISGAAVSPAMGYHSSKIVGALLTLLNARLGWWLPNPSQSAKQHWMKSEPTFGLIHLIKEFLGFTNDKSDFIHLSDGGHFDNLGLYEMIRRRCKHIVVVDAGQDAEYTYENLSNAIRMVRVDFGVDILFDAEQGPGSGKKMKQHFAIGRVVYNDKDHSGEGDSDGVIIYIKPVLLGEESVDVHHYAARKKSKKNKFPHESTVDQFFDESQFESYRTLGLLSASAFVSSIKSELPKLSGIKAPKNLAKFRNTEQAQSQDSRSASPASIGQNHNINNAIDTTSKISQLFGQASGLVTPVVASTVAAASVLTINHQLIQPKDGIPLNVPDKAIVIEAPKLLPPDGCISENGKLNCGRLEMGEVGLSKELLELKKNGLKIVSPELIKAIDPKQGLILNIDSASLIRRSTHISQNGIVLEQDSSQSLGKATNADQGLRLNKEDKELLNTVRHVGDSFGSLSTSMDSMTEQLQLIDARIRGLRNDSGGIE